MKCLLTLFRCVLLTGVSCAVLLTDISHAGDPVDRTTLRKGKRKYAESVNRAEDGVRKRRASGTAWSQAASRRELNDLLGEGQLQDDGVKQRGKGGATQKRDDGTSDREAGTEYLRMPRARTHDEKRQILSHLSSQLFEAASDRQRAESGSSNRVRPVEIEMMTDSSNNVFISANNNSTLDLVQELFRQERGFLPVVQQEYGTSGTYRNSSSARRSDKLEAFSSGTRAERKPESAAIYETIRDADRIHQIDTSVTEEQLRSVAESSGGRGGGNVFLVYGQQSERGHDLERGRHAEEKLMDVAENLGGSWSESYTVAGRKRPCMSCYGRMSFVDDRNHHGMEDGGFSVEHGEHFGRLFISSWLKQPPEIRRYTLDNVIRQGISHATVVEHDEEADRYNVRTDEDSLSDSEESERETSEEEQQKEMEVE